MKFVSSAIFLLAVNSCGAFQTGPTSSVNSIATTSTTQLNQSNNDDDNNSVMGRRGFGATSLGWLATGALGSLTSFTPAANAEVFFDPAMYGDQELRVAAVDTVRERTRRAILQNPALCTSFYQLALQIGRAHV